MSEGAKEGAGNAGAPERNRQDGVTLVKPEKCYDGYRLYSSRATEEAHIIDIHGNEVHGWAFPQGHSWHYAEMQPDGNLVAIIKDVMILELDWHGDLVWKLETRAHHDFARPGNGNTIVVSRRDLPNPWTGKGDIALDVLYEVTPANEVVWQWKVEEHADEIGDLVDLMIPPFPRFRDWPHVNTVEVLLDGPAAAKDPRFRAGNLLLCGRHIDVIFVIDRDTDKVVWAWGPGEVLGPHMPTMLPSGRMLVYDNGNNVSRNVPPGRQGIREHTRVIELDPVTGEIVWEYRAAPPESFRSPARGSNERLPNGNTFIAESDPGRLFEVTPDGEMVWEFKTPDRHKNGSRQALYRALCYPREVVDALVARYGGEVT